MDWLAIASEFEAATQQRSTARIHERWEQTLLRQPGALQDGHDINDAIRAKLNSMDDEKVCRTYHQIQMQDLFQSACTRVTYDKAFKMNQRRIMTYNRCAMIDEKL